MIHDSPDEARSPSGPPREPYGALRHSAQVLAARRRMKSGIYLLPNLVTATGLFFGFLSIRLSIEGRLLEQGGFAGLDKFVFAAYAILGAAVCDALDGSVARLTKTQSAFGVQFDSFSDLIAFGVAPSFLAYNFALHGAGRLGFAICFVFTLCAALRLARFNVQTTVGKASGNFTGIPSPMAAAPLAVYVLAQDELLRWSSESGYHHLQVQASRFLTADRIRELSLLVIVALLGFGMISTFEYLSTKTLRLPRKKPFRVFAFSLIALTLLLTVEFTLSLVILMLVYTVHGPILWLFLKRDKDAEEEELFMTEEEEDEANA